LRQHSTPENVLGPALKEIRLSRGWTLQNASARLRKAGMSCTTRQLERIEAQQREIRDFEILCFCAVLGVTHDDIGERLKEAMAQRSITKQK
jgi:transcriptional regulator with XRE-family HTH domain